MQELGELKREVPTPVSDAVLRHHADVLCWAGRRKHGIASMESTESRTPRVLCKRANMTTLGQPDDQAAEQ